MGKTTLFRRYAGDILVKPGQDSHFSCSRRWEREVLHLLALGLMDREIAENLSISEKTVHKHVENIRAKLGVRTRAAAVAEARRRGLLKNTQNY